jgi:hypothetical protein
MVQSITARRPGPDDPDVGRAVAEGARSFMGAGRYGFIDVIGLTPFAVMRTLRRDVPPGLWALTATGRHAADGVARRRGRGPSLTCSEYVYRALDAAGVAPDIAAPLVADGRLRSDWAVAGARGGPLDLGAQTETRRRAEEWRLEKVGDEAGADDENAILVTAGDGGQGVPFTPSAQRIRGRPLTVADGVTPGDLLSSPSLRTIAVYHRVLA